MSIKSKTGKVLSEWVELFSEVLNQPNPDWLFDFTNEKDIDGNNSSIISMISHATNLVRQLKH